MAESRLISVVLPVFNEDRSIGPCLRQLWAALRDHPHEILVCYDFDEDKTLPAIAAMPDRPPSVRLVRNRIGRGAANALRAGFAAATGDVVITTMADLSDPPDRIPELARVMREEDATVVAGSRYMPGGTQHGGPFLKTLLSRGAGLSLRWLAGVATHDATNNFKAYRKAFLERTTIESDHAFDIALELTAKAHLAGERIREVPSSWMDRTAGESRFQMWKWLPKYLRWYWRAMKVPAVLWTALLALTIVTCIFGRWTPQHAGADFALNLGIAAVGAGWLLWARRLRGRMSLADLPLLLLWVHPYHVPLFRQGALLGALGALTAASLAVLLLSLGPRRLARGIGASLRWFDQWKVMVAVLAAFYVVRRYYSPELDEKPGLDPSWRHALPWFATNGRQAGIDYIYTYGPLGWIEQGAFSESLYWTRVVVWFVAVRAAVAAVLMQLAKRTGGILDGTLFVLAVFLLPLPSDAHAFMAMAAIGVALLARTHPLFPGAAAGFAILAAHAAIKFTYFVPSVAIGLLVCVDFWRRRSLRSGLTAAGVFALAFAAVWLANGQNPLYLPAFVRGSLQIASGYSEAMGRTPELETLFHAGVAIGATVLLALGNVLARPRTLARVLIAAAVLVTEFVAFKGGFVSQKGSLTFYGFAALAPFFILPAPGGAPLARALGSALRASILGWCLIATGYQANAPTLNFQELPWRLGFETKDGFRELTHADGVLENLKQGVPNMRQSLSMPRTRATVGRSTIDLIGSNVIYLVENDLNWVGRPIFQSYSAYTPWLLRKNAEIFAGDDAPEYLLFHPDSMGDWFGPQFDALAMQLVVQRYEPQFIERGMLLWKRTDRPYQVAPERPLVLERTFTFGETVDLSALPTGRYAMHVDIDYTLQGSLVKAVFQAPHVWMKLYTDSGPPRPFRVNPGMLREGVIIAPLLPTYTEWVNLLLGQDPPRLEGFSLHRPSEAEEVFQPVIRLRVVRADDFQITSNLDVDRVKYSMFMTRPADIQTPLPWGRTTLRNDEAILVHAPSSIRFDVGAGTHSVSGFYGLTDNAWTGEHGISDGVEFAATYVAADGTEQDLFRRLLTPRETPADRSAHDFIYRFTTAAPTSVYLRTNSGPAASGAADFACWGRILVRKEE